MAPTRGCGTCRARKVRCDRAFPTCNRCCAAGRRCTGYGIRLSWPRPGDPRRAILGPRPPNHGLGHKNGQIQLVNVSSWDMEMQEQISMQGIENNLSLDQRGYEVDRQSGGHYHTFTPFHAQSLGPSIAFALGNLTLQEKDLYQYFVSVASFSLAAFGQNAFELRDVIFRMALSDGSHSSTAVLKSAMALSSLHRDGPQPGADRFKISALQALSAATEGVMDKPRLFQHVAAGMLLCSFETQQKSETASHWLWYVCGSKSIIKTTRLDDSTNESDFSALIRWVQYYDILGRFSLRHWRRNRIGDDVQIAGLGISGTNPTVCGDNLGGRLNNSSYEVLSLLSEVCDTVMEQSEEVRQTYDYQNYLKLLEWKISRIPAMNTEINRDLDPATWETASILELYRLATLTYLVRSTRDSARQPAKLVDWVTAAFAILTRLDTCKNPFPLLILGCEAHNDENRMVILDIISRTEEKTYTKTLAPLITIIQALWAHEDLSDGELDYSQKLHVIFSSSGFVPVLVQQRGWGVGNVKSDGQKTYYGLKA